MNLNHWLVEQGWAFPTYYTSMTNDVLAIDKLAKAAQSKKSGVIGVQRSAIQASRAGRFANPTLLIRGPSRDQTDVRRRQNAALDQLRDFGLLLQGTRSL